MRKLLLVMLVPVLVLGVMGCGGIDADVQTDYQIQGAWQFEDYVLYINAGTLVVKFVNEVSTPYRTEFSYVGSALDVPVIGDITLFNYKTNEEIASMRLTCEPKETLTIAGIDWNVEEYYYRDAFPVEGTYISLADAVVQILDPKDYDIGDFAFNPAGIAAQTIPSYSTASFATAWAEIKKSNIVWSGLGLQEPAITILGFKTKASFDALDQEAEDFSASLAAGLVVWASAASAVPSDGAASAVTPYVVVFAVEETVGWNAATLYLPFTLKGNAP